MSLLAISPTLGYRRSMASDGYFRRSPPTKPFLLRADRYRCVTIGAPLLNKDPSGEVPNEPLSLYDMRKMSSQNAARRRIVSMAENLSPRSTLLSFQDDYNPAHVRRASQLALNALYDSSPESSPPCTPDERPTSRQTGWQFPLPPVSMSSSASKGKQVHALDLCHDVLPGLGFEGLEKFTFADSALKITTTSLEPDKSPTASSVSHCDSDHAPSSHWSPSTCAPSLCEERQEEEEEISFTEPLSFRKSSGRQVATKEAEDRMEETGPEVGLDYLRPFDLRTDSDDAKLHRLHSSYSLLGMMSDGRSYLEAPSSPEPQTRGDEASPKRGADNFRLLLSPEHAAPSLAEQLAFACGNGYQYQLPYDHTHRDSAGEYLVPQSLSPLLMTPAQFSSLDPFSGLAGECGDSWSETHSNAHSPDPHVECQIAEAVRAKRSASTSFDSATSPILKDDMAAMVLMPRSKSHAGDFDRSVDQASRSTQPVVSQNTYLPLSTGDEVLLFGQSPAPQNLEEFSYLTLLDREEEPLQVPMWFGSSFADEDTLNSSPPPVETLQSSCPATLSVQCSPMLSPGLPSSVSLGGGRSLAPLNIEASYSPDTSFGQTKRSSTVTSILDRGRPIRPTSGGNFLGQREEKIHIIKLKTSLSSSSSGRTINKLHSTPVRERSDEANVTSTLTPVRVGSDAVTTVHPSLAVLVDSAKTTSTHEQMQPVSPADNVKKEWILRTTAPAHPHVPTGPVAAMKTEENRSPGVHFRNQLPTVQVATRVRIMSSSTARGVPMGMVRSTSRPSDGAGIESPTKATTAPSVKMLSAEASAALREAKLEVERKKGTSMAVKPRPAMLPGVQSAGDVPRSLQQTEGEGASNSTGKSSSPPSAPERSHSAPAAAAISNNPITSRPARPLRAAARPCHSSREKGLGFVGMPSSYSLPTIFTARTVSQRFRGETGLAETEATLKAAAAAAGRSNGKPSSSPLSKLMMLTTESGVKVEKGVRSKRWGMVKALSQEERCTAKLVTPSGCVLILQEQTVVKEGITSA